MIHRFTGRLFVLTDAAFLSGLTRRTQREDSVVNTASLMKGRDGFMDAPRGRHSFPFNDDIIAAGGKPLA